MTITKRDCETIRRCVRKPMNTVSREIVVLLLFAVCDDRRACGFKPLDGISNRIFIKKSELRIFIVALCNFLDEIDGSWNTTDWLGRYSDRWRLNNYFIVVGWPHVDLGTIALWLDCTTGIY